MRIALMVIRNIFLVPYFLIKILWLEKHSTKEKIFAFIKKIVTRANKSGRVNIEVNGLENLPESDGFVLFPNHQGMFDMLVFLQTCPRPFSFVFKKEVSNIVLVKQVVDGLGSLAIDRSDLRQSMRVIQEMTKRVSAGENFLIFAEGTRSKNQNHMLDMKGGSFKSAVKAKCPIVPCALVDCYKPFDIPSIKKVDVKVFYLEPITYSEYKDLTTLEIANLVKERIEKVLDKYN